MRWRQTVIFVSITAIFVVFVRVDSICREKINFSANFGMKQQQQQQLVFGCNQRSKFNMCTQQFTFLVISLKWSSTLFDFRWTFCLLCDLTIACFGKENILKVSFDQNHRSSLVTEAKKSIGPKPGVPVASHWELMCDQCLSRVYSPVSNSHHGWQTKNQGTKTCNRSVCASEELNGRETLTRWFAAREWKLPRQTRRRVKTAQDCAGTCSTSVRRSVSDSSMQQRYNSQNWSRTATTVTPFWKRLFTVASAATRYLFLTSISWYTSSLNPNRYTITPTSTSEKKEQSSTSPRLRTAALRA